MRVETETKILIPNGVLDYSPGLSHTTDIENALTDTGSTTFAHKELTNSHSPLYFTFDFSPVPQSATLSNLELKVKYNFDASTSGLRTIYGGAYFYDCITSAISGTGRVLSNTTAVTTVVVSGNGFTREDLDKLAYGIGASGSSWLGVSYLNIYGARLTATYDVTLCSVSAESSTALASLDVGSSGTSGEVASGDSVAITISSTTSVDNLIVLDNGTDITSQFTFIEYAGEYQIWQATLSGISTDHVITAKAKSPVKIKMDGSWHTVVTAKYKGSNGQWIDFQDMSTFMSYYDFSRNLHFYQNALAEALTFDISENGIIFWKADNAASAKTIEYSVNGGPWTAITSTVEAAEIPVSAGDSVRLRGNNDVYNGNHFITFCSFDARGNIMSLIDAEDYTGNKTLVSGETFQGLFAGCVGLGNASNIALPATAITSACYKEMFRDCYNLVGAPALPAATLAANCYENMFKGCGRLTNAPKLPANVLATSCYAGMFEQCSNMTGVQNTLSAPVMASYCYQSMFKDCVGLTNAPALPSTELNYGCYWGMFDGCTNLATPPELPAGSLDAYSYKRMFRNCVSMETGPDIPDILVLATSCFEEMFYGCSNLNYIRCLANSRGEVGSGECKDWMYGVASSGTFVTNGFGMGWIHNSPDGIPEGWDTRFEGAENNTSPLTLFILSDGNINFRKSNSSMPNTYVNYQINNGEWLGFNVNTSAATGTCTINVHAGEMLKLSTSNFRMASGDSRYITMRYSTASFNAGGNILSMIANKKSETEEKYGYFPSAYTIASAYALCMMFAYETPIINADGLIMQASGLSSNAYRNMFYENTSLKSAAFRLDGKTMADCAYLAMFNNCTNLVYSPINMGVSDGSLSISACMYTFSGCTKLKTTPELPVSVAPNYCFKEMFAGCTSLENAPKMTLNGVGQNSCENMFNGCSSLKIAPELPATTVAKSCYAAMFKGCTSLIKAPSILPAMTLAQTCYQYMFEKCSSLTVGPVLPAHTLTAQCYHCMFSGCTSLNYVAALFTTTPTSSYTQNWMANVNGYGKFIKSSNATWNVTGIHGKPANFDVITLEGDGGPILWVERFIATTGYYDETEENYIPTSTNPADLDGEWFEGWSEGIGYETFMETYTKNPFSVGASPFIYEGTIQIDGVTYYLYKNCTDEVSGVCYALSEMVYDNPESLRELSCLKDINERFQPFQYFLSGDKSDVYEIPTAQFPVEMQPYMYFLVRP